MNPNTPPVFWRAIAVDLLPMSLAYCSHARNRNARSRVKNREKNMTVDRNVQMSNSVVKMNQPVRKKPSGLDTLPS